MELTGNVLPKKWIFYLAFGKIQSGAPNENIVQNHLNIALLNAF